MVQFFLAQKAVVTTHISDNMLESDHIYIYWVQLLFLQFSTTLGFSIFLTEYTNVFIDILYQGISSFGDNEHMILELYKLALLEADPPHKSGIYIIILSN